MRLVRDQSRLIQRTPAIEFSFDGHVVQGHAGESVAAALWRVGLLGLRMAPDRGGARGLFCCMGMCQECVVRLEGRAVESCRLTVSEGLCLSRAEWSP